MVKKTFKNGFAFTKSIANEAILNPLKSYDHLFDYYLRKLNEQNLYEYLLNENITYFTKT
jgi:hypothetical protein